MALRTRLSRLLGVEHPIIQGGMAWTATAELAAAVSNAGGFGIIGAGHMPTDVLRSEIRNAKLLTDKPFGVNLMLLTPHIDEIVEMVLEEGVHAVTTGAGNPGKYMTALKDDGIKVLPIAPSRRAGQAHGVHRRRRDHRRGHGGRRAHRRPDDDGARSRSSSTRSAFRWSPPAASPTAAAWQRRSRSAPRACRSGTRFMCAEECTIHPDVKEQVIRAKDRDTVVTGRSTGHPVRVLKNKLSQADRGARPGQPGR